MFANSDFLIPLSLQHNVEALRIMIDQIIKSLGVRLYKYIVIRKSEFVAKTQFLSSVQEFI